MRLPIVCLLIQIVRLSVTLACGLCRRFAVRPVVFINVMVSAGLALQGCALNLADLDDTSFNSHNDSRPDLTAPAAVGPGNTPGPIARKPVPVDESGQKNPVISIAGETNHMLDYYGYSKAVDSEKPPANSWVTDSPLQSFEGTAHSEKVLSVDVVDAPVKAVLYSLAVDASLQLHSYGQLDSLVTAGIANKPLDQILDVLAEQANFTWHISANILTIRGGEAYGDTYAVNYLNIQRSTQSSVGLATRVGTINASDSSGNSIANSSQTRIQNSSEHQFWQSLETDIQSIVKQALSSSTVAESEFSINREAGLLTLFAAPEVHRALKRYLQFLHGSTQRQVLIEATVVEVALSENFEAGVDWQMIAKGISGVNAAQILLGAPSVAKDTIDRLTGPAGLVSVVQQGGRNDVQATLSLLEQFGDVRILSRPRIIAMNNQSSVLKVVDNRVYFTVNVQRRQTEEDDEIITETQIHTVPVGLVMNVTPQISQNGTVMLNVRPTLSRILGFVNDPNPELALANVRNGVPEIQVREMESMLQVQSGEVAIIGGLMQETQSENDARLPGLAQIPVIGKIFSAQSRERRQTELLIVLRPTVLQTMAGALR